MVIYTNTAPTSQQDTQEKHKKILVCLELHAGAVMVLKGSADCVSSSSVRSVALPVTSKNTTEKHGRLLR